MRPSRRRTPEAFRKLAGGKAQRPPRNPAAQIMRPGAREILRAHCHSAMRAVTTAHTNAEPDSPPRP
jgi:hypothetical protein